MQQGTAIPRLSQPHLPPPRPRWIGTPVDSLAPFQRERLLKLLVQELDGALPGKASCLGVIHRAILFEEPMCGPRVRVEGGLPSGSPEIMLHLGDRLSRLEGVIFRVVEEIGSLSSAIVQSG